MFADGLGEDRLVVLLIFTHWVTPKESGTQQAFSECSA